METEQISNTENSNTTKSRGVGELTPQRPQKDPKKVAAGKTLARKNAEAKKLYEKKKMKKRCLQLK